MSSRTFIALGSIVFGIFLAWLAAPFIFTHLPNDRDRIRDVVRIVQTQPKVAIVGNSVVMQLGFPNLATPGQTIGESVMLANELHGRVILVVTPWQLATPATLNAQGWNAWWMYGFRPSAETRALVAMPELNDAMERFRSRWVVRAAFESAFARGKRNDEVWQGRERFAIDETQRKLIERIVARRDVVVVLAPLSPIVRAHYGNWNVHFGRTIDATNLLQPNEFRDATHPTDAGARKLTTFIEEHL
ncbi:MAG TPA: hypothetical protein VJ901_15860 [Thermoanaerobaculia bacterium]|nr:hypothetical protein [Thermoanaerobaculia bacterium]